MAKKEFKWYERRRENWWEPYTWERHGIGMARPLDEDYSGPGPDGYGIKNKTIETLTLYGLQGQKDFLAMRVCVGFDDRTLVLDRGVHSLGDITCYDIKTGRELGKVSTATYLAIEIKKQGYKGKLFDKPFPAKNITPIEKRIEEFEGRTVEKLMVSGNHTAAVGELIHDATFYLSGQKNMRISIARINKESYKERLGPIKGINELTGLLISANIKEREEIEGGFDLKNTLKKF